MTENYDYGDYTNPVKDGTFSTEHAAAVLVISALVALILLRRGFRGVGVAGVGHVGIG